MIDEYAIPILMVGLTLIGYFIGGHFRGITHMTIPFKEPLSLILAFISSMPWIVQEYAPDLAVIDADSVWTISIIMGFWVGYIIGYLQNQVDIIYISVHKIVEMEQDIHYLVRYTNKYGQTCWQPQSFWGCCKTVFFGIHNPLSLTGNIYRTRHVSIRKIIMRIQADAVDVAGIETEENIVNRGPFKFKVVARRYVPSPNVTDVPYNFIVNAVGFNELFMECANLQKQAIESKSELLMSSIKGGATLLNAMSVNNISQPIVEKLRLDLQSAIDEKTKKEARKIYREGEETDTNGSVE